MQINNTANNSNGFSKALGGAVSSKGDQYVQNLLNSIYRNDTCHKNLNFNTDDNGLLLVMQALGGKSTFGFDFDIYETESSTVIEFLKRENSYISNLTAHPSRYPANKKKFISLWNAAQRLNKGIPNFYCVNYSDDDNEPTHSKYIRF
ncbi:hypothetical protein [Niallia circulans]|uniref:hypothetical protein n=1 Tax=Niallia circulans TaxID=1397 RepID=UPI0015603262|nr:hypothetical protein [Niallia circulans]NRG35109.1 hypothetical protein [Niallia circulans]